ncbi:hypothetical protein Prum_071550 [Phytohabitans rumicis]|uniref:Uncharacterized protein n=1 Tax=Phytohabitans rumicis TaxID=1076125 RepID=A0A6V8L8C5_9ACTN|nr:hypothetical protein Prum_071550 [Phytohabitans rumicis]
MNEAGVPALHRSSTAEPADGHAGAAGATHGGIWGTTGGSYGNGVVATVRPATNDNTKQNTRTDATGARFLP